MRGAVAHRPDIRARSRVVVALCTVAAVAGASCTSANDQFCERLSADYRLTSMVEAIRGRDMPAIERELETLRELRWQAPAEIADELAEVVDTTEEVVRAVTGSGEGAGGAPTDLTTLNDRLARIEPETRRIAAFADENCAIDLDR